MKAQECHQVASTQRFSVMYMAYNMLIQPQVSTPDASVRRRAPLKAVPEKLRQKLLWRP